MISFLKGEVSNITSNSLEIVCRNIGYKVYCPARTLAAYALGDAVEVFTHLYLRQDAQELYGFETREERDFFEVLIGISGIGPKTALGVLAVAPLGILKKAIASGDTSILTRVSGIGQKTAQRIIMELKDKVGEQDGGSEILREGGDVIEALTGLGYTRTQAQEALRKIPESMEGVENKVKEALKILGK